MPEQLEEIREGLMQATGRITGFWGFGKTMGQLYGLLYLSPEPMSLDAMGRCLSVSKGNVSVNIRALERWNMARQVWVKGDRKDYYEAETDFWKILKGVLREREKKEFDQALSSIGDLLKKSKDACKKGSNKEAAFVVERLKGLEDFVSTVDKLVAAVLTLEDLKKNFLGINIKK